MVMGVTRTRTQALAESTPSARKPLLWGVFIAVLFALLPLLLSSYQLSLATEILIFALLAMSIDMLAGYIGLVSLSHGAIFGTATYVALYWDTVLGGSPWLGLGLGISAAVGLSMVFALFATRVTGVYFLLLTLALGMVVWGVCLRWTSITGGENGIRGSGRPELIADSLIFYYVILMVVLILMWGVWRFVKSPFGLTLNGIRDSASRMRSLGYNVPLHVFLAFTVSGFVAGVAGACYALFNNFVSPSTVELSQSVEGLLMAIIGGVGTLVGSFIGAAVIIILENTVSDYTERWPMVLGGMFIVTMILAPEGILGALRKLLERVRNF